jgi:hypothetical protein
MTAGWPTVSYDRWAATCDTLHAHTQVLGKLAARLVPPEPQLQHAALRLTARGWETAPLPAPDGCGSLVVALDLHTHQAVVEQSGGQVERVPLTPNRAVADVTSDVLAAVAAVGGAVQINPGPQEVPWTVPLDRDYEDASYDPERVSVYFTAATQAALTLTAFRAPFRARSTPVNAWWGTFDLAVALFSGLPADAPSNDSSCATRPTPKRSRLAGGPETLATQERPSSRSLTPPRPPSHTDVCRRPLPAGTTPWASTSSIGTTSAPRPTPRGGTGLRPLRVPPRLPDLRMGHEPGRHRRQQATPTQIKITPNGTGGKPRRFAHTIRGFAPGLTTRA